MVRLTYHILVVDYSFIRRCVKYQEMTGESEIRQNGP